MTKILKQSYNDVSNSHISSLCQIFVTSYQNVSGLQLITYIHKKI
jgi:hypothetical protein